MKYINGLIKSKLNNWLNKEWYHQRFDGAPYIMFMTSEGEIVTHEKRKRGTDFTVHFVFFENDHVDWYISKEDIERITKRVIELARENSNISLDMINEWKNDEELFFKKCGEILHTDLNELRDDKLIKLHDEFVQLCINRNSSSSTIDGFALGSDELIADMIKKSYDKNKPKERFAEIFSILTSPSKLSFTNEAEASLLRVALEIEKEGLKTIFNLSNSEITNKLKNHSALYDQLMKHQRDYFWLGNNYAVHKVLELDYFIDQIKNLFELKLDIQSEIMKIENAPNENKKKKKQIISELGIDFELLTLLKISDDFTYWQDERKRASLWAMHYFSMLLEAISRRIGISIHEINYLFPREVINIFENKTDRKILGERIKNSVYYMDKEGCEAVYGKDCDDVREKLIAKKDIGKIDDFRGLTACVGKAIGRVKILMSSKEMGKVEKGDILVAVMTRPDYVPAMKKAAAIVTDEGGITCHAAIVARELGIPCIIGTKIATKLLKDGQLVEVNANHGWVKIIKE